jgi:hypothetical protein
MGNWKTKPWFLVVENFGELVPSFLISGRRPGEPAH